MTPENPPSPDTPKLQSAMPDPAGSASLVDRQLIRRILPVVAGTILGGLLTGIPTVWVSVTQQRVQVDLARRAEQEQLRQRRVQTAKNYLTACSEMALTAEHLADSLESGGKISALTNEHRKAKVVYSVSLAEVVAEFGFSEISLSDSVAVLDLAESSGTRAQLSSKERKSSRFPDARQPHRRIAGSPTVDQESRSACGSVTVPGFSSAARVAQSRYAFGSTPQSFADSMRL